jgi:diguanylate cyclase (GGDEF)-like protein
MNVLIIDDEPTVRGFLSDFMATVGEFKVAAAGDPREGLALFETTSPNVILLDIHMPNQSGFDLLRTFKERGGAFEVIIMTGNAHIEDTLTAIKYGAYDFILKPFSDLDMLERSIRRAADTVRLRLQNEELLRQLTQKNLELEMANRKLEKLSVTDDLTGLFNMRYMNEYVAREIDRSSRYGRAFAFVILDLDNLKAINDAHGHMAGSRMIQEVASAIRSMTRRTDTVARFGGDEFLIFADEAGREAAMALAGRVRAQIEAIRLEFDGAVLKTTASLGVSCFPGDGNDYQKLFAKADEAMYKAKSNGKNRVEVAG